jgi:hypothetical protein
MRRVRVEIYEEEIISADKNIFGVPESGVKFGLLTTMDGSFFLWGGGI